MCWFKRHMSSQTATLSVSLSPPPPTVTVIVDFGSTTVLGQDKAVHRNRTYLDGSSAILTGSTWTTSNTALATITSAGLTAVASGTVTVQAVDGGRLPRWLSPLPPPPPTVTGLSILATATVTIGQTAHIHRGGDLLEWHACQT